MVGHNAYLEHLATLPLFSSCSKRDLQKIARAGDAVTVAPGRVLVDQGEIGREAFVILDGTATVKRNGRKIATLGPGDHFGELAMISRRERMATVEALTPMRCHTIQFWDFRAFAKKNPDVMWKLLQHVAGILLKEQSRHPAHAESASP